MGLPDDADGKGSLDRGDRDLIRILEPRACRHLKLLITLIGDSSDGRQVRLRSW
jgi:hypothetical protein